MKSPNIQDANKLLIVIVTFNSKDLIDQCLKSVFENLTKWKFAVCVVDNGSRDGTQDHIRKNFPETILLQNQNNLGYSYANNQGIKHIKSDYVLLLNSDTIVPKNAFQKMVDFLERDENIGVIGPKLVRLNGAMDPACRRMLPSHLDYVLWIFGLLRKLPQNRIFGHYNLTFLDPNETTDVDSVSGAFLLARRTAIEKVGLLDEIFFFYGEDIDWCYRFKLNNWRVVYCPEVTVIHLKGGSSRKTTQSLIYHFYRSNVILYKKYGSKKTFFLINWILLFLTWCKFILSYIYNYFLPDEKKRVA
jgi:hypothetical protein